MNKELKFNKHSKQMEDSEPKYEVGKWIEAFGFYDVVESVHWSDTWDEYFYVLEDQRGRTPESEIRSVYESDVEFTTSNMSGYNYV